MQPIERLHELATGYPVGPNQCTFKSLWGIADSLLTGSPYLYELVIDGLDECSFGGKFPLDAAEFVNTICESMCKRSHKVLIFTRPEPDFEDLATPDISIHLTPEKLLPDIRIFADLEYERLRLPVEQKRLILDRIDSQSNGSFRWVEMYLDYLHRSLRNEDIQQRMHALPPGISDFYRLTLVEASRALSLDELDCRRSIFLMDFQSQRPLQLAEISSALSLQPRKARQIVLKLCKPLITIEDSILRLSHPSVREFFEQYDFAHDTSLGIDFSMSHEVLAEKCLSILLKEENKDFERIGKYLTANHGENSILDTTTSSCEAKFFNYASRFWDYHITQTRCPSPQLLEQAETFLSSLQFVLWAEYSRQDYGQYVAVFQALGRLKDWNRQISMSRPVLDLTRYFAQPYEQYISMAETRSSKSMLGLLAGLGLGDYHLAAVNVSNAIRVWTKNWTGLRRCLGPNHRLTLRSRRDVAYGHMYVGSMCEAREVYSEIIAVQETFPDPNDKTFIETEHYMGENEYYMADFAAAAVTFTKTSAAFLRLLGPESWQYLGAQLWYALALAHLNELEVSLEILSSVCHERQRQYGLDDVFAGVVRVGIGEVQQLLGRHEDSVATLQKCLEQRRVMFPESHIFKLDVEIALAASLQAAGRNSEAASVLTDIKENGKLDSLVGRSCHVTGLQGLLLADDGYVDEAIDLMLHELIQCGNKKQNRALLWIRLDVAKMLRQRNGEGDVEQASSIFDGVVQDISGGREPEYPDEPDPPRLLMLAEKALWLVRARRFAEARQELDSERADWARPSDFWLYVGGTFF